MRCLSCSADNSQGRSSAFSAQLPSSADAKSAVPRTHPRPGIARNVRPLTGDEVGQLSKAAAGPPPSDIRVAVDSPEPQSIDGEGE
jgi:hypothetical protein